MSLNKEQLQFFFDEVLGELGWCDEIEETGIDPLAYVRDEIKKMQAHTKRVNRPLVSSDALFIASTWDTVADNNYLTKEFTENFADVVTAANSASKKLAQMAAGEA